MTEPHFESPAAAEASFYGAFAAADGDAMARVWGRTGPILCVHPGGSLLLGRDAVLQSWSEIFSGTRSPAIEHQLIEAFTDADLAVHLVEERIRPSKGSRDEPTRVIATNTYRREPGGWRLVAHHGSLPLVPRRSPSGIGPRVH